MTDERSKKTGEVKGYIYSRETFGTVDGPGIRYVFFLQGCPLCCLYCHNADSRPFSGGEEWTAAQVVTELRRYKGFIKSGGVTFSGGEPMYQAEFLVAVLTLLKQEGIHTTIDTAGCYSVEDPNVKAAVDLTDLILLDIKSIDKKVSEELSGITSDNAFEMLDYCESIGKPVWVRQVLLRGYTLDKEQLSNLAEKLYEYKCIQRIELLPFHKLGELKWEGLEEKYQLSQVEATTKQELDWAREIFLSKGLNAK